MPEYKSKVNRSNLVEHCEYSPLKEEMIRDWLVVGMHDMALSERLQMDEILTLDKIKKLVHQREAVKEQQLFLKKDEITLDYVKQKPGPSRTKDRVPFYLKTDLVQKRTLQQRPLLNTLMLSVTSHQDPRQPGTYMLLSTTQKWCSRLTQGLKSLQYQRKYMTLLIGLDCTNRRRYSVDQVDILWMCGAASQCN